MLHIRTRAKSSPVHGVGLFAEEFIPKGTVVWTYNESVDRIISPEDIALLPTVAREFLEIYGNHLKDGSIQLSFDHARFVNHSNHPNVGPIESGQRGLSADVALRDIEVGEEIFYSYPEISAEQNRLD